MLYDAGHREPPNLPSSNPANVDWEGAIRRLVEAMKNPGPPVNLNVAKEKMRDEAMRDAREFKKGQLKFPILPLPQFNPGDR